MATSGDHYLATSGDFFMATDTPPTQTVREAATRAESTPPRRQDAPTQRPRSDLRETAPAVQLSAEPCS